ncbi:Hypothetical predicted protein [Mytilus galloprovincialis]|uniref:Uncharacterized protein n=1 Tax=Mytilus galloprovincialis TaxID=29158 RepID=A0A8B6E5P9_MYTGA|nr:Hypothetical predicted protein [Mytilus galloprovincialis]
MSTTVLTSCPTKEEAVKLMKDTQQALAKYGNLRLHKFASNCAEVMSAFHASDLASNLKDLDLECDSKPLQRSLGLSWDVNTDNFLFQLSSENKPITRRGILSTINSLYDPLGFLAPVIIQGKLLLRKIVSETVDWDQPLTDETADEWKSWRDTLIAIETLRIPRTYVPYLSKTATKELHVFSDASEKAIAAVAYLRTTDSSGEPNIGFILGKAKVAPTSGHTIPRLELSAAVLAVEITQTIMDNLDLHIDTVKFYTDSKVVLGYISNETRRVEKIRKFSSPSQWNYVPTNRNPADSGTRSVLAHEIHSSEWLLGPKQLLSSEQKNSEDIYQLIDPEEDGEIRAIVNVAKTFSTPEHKGIGTDRFNQILQLDITCASDSLFGTRFAAIRGQVKIFRSDRGTNFIGAIDDLKIDSINVEDGPFKNFLYNSGTTWIFNPPHSSHMGGAWERMIGITRRILDSMLLNAAGKKP